MENKLFTFGIVAYNNYSFIKEAVDSLIGQDYSEIELIISNDGSKDFNEEELSEYIQINKGENIKSVQIHNNEKNLGTVKNVNYVCGQAHGAYLMLMAADDALFDSGVLSRFVQEFEARKDSVQILMAKIAMCGERLDDIRDYQPVDERIDLLKSGDNSRIFSVLTHDSFMPTTSTCFKMDVLRETGFYDEDYFVIEDASKFIRLARDGYRFGWIDDMVAARHRDGGISHGNSRNRSESYRRYRFDEIILYTKEILPYINQIYPEDIKPMEHKWNYIEGAYYRDFLLQENGTLDYREYDEKICRPIVKEFSKKYGKIKIKEWIRNRADMVSLKKTFGRIFLVLAGFLVTGFLDTMVELQIINVLKSVLLGKICIIGMYILLCFLFLEGCIAVMIRGIRDICYFWRRYNEERKANRI